MAATLRGLRRLKALALLEDAPGPVDTGQRAEPRSVPGPAAEMPAHHHHHRRRPPAHRAARRDRRPGIPEPSVRAHPCTTPLKRPAARTTRSVAAR